MSLHEQGRYRLGPPPLVGHIATCRNCDWMSKPRGRVETAARDFEQHQRASRPLPHLVEGDCALCGVTGPQRTEFFGGLGYARLCPDCIKRLHRRNVELRRGATHNEHER